MKECGAYLLGVLPRAINVVTSGNDDRKLPTRKQKDTTCKVESRPTGDAQHRFKMFFHVLSSVP